MATKASHEIYAQQVGLKELGHDPGVIDGLDGPKTQAALKSFYSDWKGSGPDGLPDPPRGNTSSKEAVFGPPGNESALKRVKLPWKMAIVGMPGKFRTTIRMHELIADRMIEALEAFRTKHGMDNVKKYGLDLFGGDYVNRPPRGSSSGYSDHAWGIALDLNPSANGLKHDWNPDKLASNGTREMSEFVVSHFKSFGFSIGFERSTGKRQDMMHVAYVNR